jgi:hypothetical protein
MVAALVEPMWVTAGGTAATVNTAAVVPGVTLETGVTPQMVLGRGNQEVEAAAALVMKETEAPGEVSGFLVRVQAGLALKVAQMLIVSQMALKEEAGVRMLLGSIHQAQLAIKIKPQLPYMAVEALMI